MKFDTEIYREISGIQRSVQKINESLKFSTEYYSYLLSEALRVREMLKKINEDKNIPTELSDKINDCWYILDKACKKLI